jgi:hypothetical protein
MSALGALALALAIGGYVPYLLSTWRGVTRPNRASWWIYSATGLFATASSFAAGARATLLVPLAYGVCSLAVVALAVRRGEGGWTRLDRACIATAIASLAVWWLSGDALVAVAMNAVADTAGNVPTMLKAWREPEREHGWSWACFLAGDLVNLAQLATWDTAAVLYPLTLTVNAAVVVAFCLMRRAAARR